MQESRFVEQNKQKWADLESLLKKADSEPEKLTDHFVQVSEDLSYARTHYTNRSVRIYLNHLTQRIFQTIYKNRKNRWKQVVYFWQYELPYTMYQSRKELLVSFVLFAIAFFIGMFSCKNDPAFAGQILGDSYVQMTLNNIENKDPMAVYKQAKHIDMFLGITINNVRVALITFVFGVLVGIGTAGFILYNGIMVGAFQYFFIQRGLFQESFLTIWLHGTLEISSIILAGAAGFALGKGLFFPATYSRFQSFQMGARKGIRIMMGIIPLFVLAGFIEGFLTRYTEMPDLLRLALILLSLFFIIFYFVYYPFRVARSPEAFYIHLDESPDPVQLQTSNSSGLRSFAELFSASIQAASRFRQALVGGSLFLSVTVTVLWLFFINPDLNLSSYRFSPEWIAHNFFQYLNFEEYGWKAFLCITLSLAVLQFALFRNLKKEQITPFSFVAQVRLFIYAWWLVGIFYVALFLHNGFITFLFLLLLPIAQMSAIVLLEEDTNPFKGIFRSFSLLSESWLMAIGPAALVVFLTTALNTFLMSEFVWQYIQTLLWSLADQDPWILSAVRGIQSTLTLFTFFISYGFFFLNTYFLYQNLKELQTGTALREKINQLRIRKVHVL